MAKHCCYYYYYYFTVFKELATRHQQQQLKCMWQILHTIFCSIKAQTFISEIIYCHCFRKRQWRLIWESAMKLVVSR